MSLIVHSAISAHAFMAHYAKLTGHFENRFFEVS